MRGSIVSSVLFALCVTSAVAAPHGSHNLFFGNSTTGHGRPGHPFPSGTAPSGFPGRPDRPRPSGFAPSGFPSHHGNGSAPSQNTTHHEEGGKEHIVIFDANNPNEPSIEHVLNQLELHTNHSDVIHIYNNSAFRGFSAKMKSHCISKLNVMAEVSHVEEASEVRIKTTDVRESATWGLQRISSSSTVSGDSSKLEFTYSYTDSALGAGVDLYVVDTGIYTEHYVFGGRASMIFSLDGDSTDGDGHGTHCAGTAAGTVFGVASGANLFGVKVLNDQGSGSSSDTIAGINKVIAQHDERKANGDFVASIMSMSWGLGGTSAAISNVIEKAVGVGIHAVVAAGNDNNQDSCTISPASSGGDNGPAITVGSIGIDDTVSGFSNTGSCNDVYAPGEDVLSAWIGTPQTVNYLSGTSMATPHVAGVVAYLCAENSTLATDPAAMKEYIRSTALTDIVSGTTNSGDPKLLINNGVTGEEITGILAHRSGTPKVEVSKSGIFSRAFRLFNSEKAADTVRFILSRSGSRSVL